MNDDDHAGIETQPVAHGDAGIETQPVAHGDAGIETHLYAPQLEAFGRLQSHPRWDEVKQRTLEAGAAAPCSFRSLADGLACGLSYFSSVAEAHLSLVSNSQSAADVSIVLELVTRGAYNTAGIPPPECIEKPSAQIQAFQVRIAELERQFKIRALARGRRQFTTSERARERSAWLDKQLGGRGEKHIRELGGPDYKTIQVYRSGAITRETNSVRAGLAKAFRCDLSEVPE